MLELAGDMELALQQHLAEGLTSLGQAGVRGLKRMPEATVRKL